MKTKKYIQITAGRGPVECTWVVAKVLKVMLVEARNNGLSAEVLHREPGLENGTLLSVIVIFKGNNLGIFLQNWVGTIQWIGKSEFRKFQKRKNWFVGVNEIEVSSLNQELKASDLSWDTFRSSGAGGQHVNKVETAVRVTHIPSGLFASCSESRSQHQNRKKALEKLKELVKIKQVEKAQEELANNWQNHNELERGNPIRVFRGNDFKPKNVKSKTRQNRSAEKQKWKKQWKQIE